MTNKAQEQKKWLKILGLAGLGLLFILAVSIYKGTWFLTALPAGFLFGFFLQKGDLCGASAFSEVLIMKDWRKIWGLWVCIAVSMIAFALLDLLGLAQLNPKPFLWLSYIVGGAVFGAGTVLAGGCVSGCLYKAATGNLNSMAALAGIPIGIAVVEYGMLSPLHTAMKIFLIKSGTGGAITLSSLTGLPFWIPALGFGLATIIFAFKLKRSRRSDNQTGGQKSLAETWLFSGWKPWQAGLAIGLLAAFAYLSSAASGRNYPLGVTHGVLQAQYVITESHAKNITGPAPVSASVVKPAAADVPSGQAPKPKKIVWWLVLLVLSLMAGAFVSGKLSGQARLLPKPPEQTVIAFFGGILVGAGAAIGTGCVIGNILSGWALMSIGMLVFGVVTILANWITTYFYLMGGKFPGKG